MNPIRLLDLGYVSPLHSQTVYHAVGHALAADAPDTIILVSSDRPYVCIGYHQAVEKEVDLDYCRERGLPVYRREVGGGAVYLDDGQLFTQWVFHAGHLPVDLEARFELYVRPLVETYQALGIPAYLRPINDVHVGGKKIGGTGAAQMGDAEVVVGQPDVHLRQGHDGARAQGAHGEDARQGVPEPRTVYDDHAGAARGPARPGRGEAALRRTLRRGLGRRDRAGGTDGC